ncbi:DUF3106 domain-containing protein [Pelomonas sp. SE-A7]|uniref:DUF3106 domain-containing protein n=1 Tax=Pelomonas sp. SE-A7 TaxID=3054953 RepID=UPI00259C88CC|nr:DUF3106 domain-containing protein [Pelomonas sp. SE-A7]MDM4767438.1 DUF3106 domain-containing protein [Pelomonas sp. SE-A7]
MTRRPPLATRFSFAPLTVLLLGLGAVASQAQSSEAAASSAVATKPAASAVATSGARWRGLSGAHQRILAPLEKDWDSLDAQSQGKWLELAGRYNTLPAAEQQRVQERMSEWANTSPAERQRARVGYQGAQQIKVDDRQAKWEAYQSLPAEKRQELAAKAAEKASAASVKVPSPGAGTKSNLVPAASTAPVARPVAPSVLQAKPGATTVLITQAPARPSHQMPGMPKLIADPSLVDPKTLLPRPASAPVQ